MPFLTYVEDDSEADDSAPAVEFSGGSEFTMEGDGATTSGIEFDTQLGGHDVHIISSETISPDGTSVLMQTWWENGSVVATSIVIASESGVDTYASAGGEPVTLIGHDNYPAGG
jgi:hypothetical protein